MPEFILDHGSPETARQFQALDSFTQGYIEAMFFTSTGPDNAEEDLEHATVAELAPSALARIIEDCTLFQSVNDGLLEMAVNNPQGIDYTEQRAGNDYWYSRNGHGTGFWDRGFKDLPNVGNVGDKLHEAAGFHQVDIYRGDDGLIYLS